MTIRDVRPEDAESIAAIYNVYVTGTTVSFETEAVTADEMRRRIAVYSCDFPYLVCENPDGTVAGYCYAHPWKNRPAYSQTLETTVYVDKKFHGQGVGRRLMEILIDRCRTAGYGALIACITAENEASLRFHESLGFSQVSHFRGVGRKFGRWLDVADMELQLL